MNARPFLLAAALILGAAVARPTPAEAHWSRGWGFAPAPAWVAPRVWVAPPPAYLPPPVVVAPAYGYGPVWVPPHWDGWGRWIPGHWR